jgi:hypothetical protein
MVRIDNMFMLHLLKCTQRFSSIKLRTGGEGWTAICVSSRALCDGYARNRDKMKLPTIPLTSPDPKLKDKNIFNR